jgi:hypothetical protein
MSDDDTNTEAEEISDFTYTDTIDPQSQVDLNEEWIAWLAEADLPSGVDGVDSSKDDLGATENYA